MFGEGNAANYLTISALGRVAKQPELKFCAVNLERVAAAAAGPNGFQQRAGRPTARPPDLPPSAALAPSTTART
jgi:hypothetical protein